MFSQAIKGMLKSHDRVGEKQAGADSPHDLPDFFPHLWFIAVNLAFAAGGLAFLKGTVRQPLAGIAEQLFTVPA